MWAANFFKVFFLQKLSRFTDFADVDKQWRSTPYYMAYMIRAIIWPPFQTLVSLGLYFRICVSPLRAPDFCPLTNKSFRNKFNLERKSKGPVMPFLDIVAGNFVPIKFFLIVK